MKARTITLVIGLVVLAAAFVPATHAAASSPTAQPQAGAMTTVAPNSKLGYGASVTPNPKIRWGIVSPNPKIRGILPDARLSR